MLLNFSECKTGILIAPLPFGSVACCRCGACRQVATQNMSPVSTSPWEGGFSGEGGLYETAVAIARD